MNFLLHLCLISVVYGQDNKLITPVDYEVPHEVIFRDEQCWSAEEGDLIVPMNCSSNYCSKCFFNKEIRDYRNYYMSSNDNKLIVGALDSILAFDVTDNLFRKLQQENAEPTEIDEASRPACISRSETRYNQESCRNYNRILVKLPELGDILTCGTNAYNEANACQIREVNNLAKSKKLNGEGFVPINENAWNTAIVSDSRIFAGTMLSNSPNNNFFVISSAKIAPGGTAFGNIVASTPGTAWLNRAKFVASFASGDYAYFLFQEIDYVYDPDSSDAMKNKVVSRIARVCKEDGGLQVDDLSDYIAGARLWKTFVKARIYCENKVDDRTFGEQTFTYNRIGDGVIDENRILYAAFSEGDTSASGSVVCRFNLTEIDKNFDSAKYWNFNGDRVRRQDRNPPTCLDMDNTESVDIYSLRLTVDHIKSKDPPLFLKAGPQFTKLLIDTSVRNITHPVLFIGTNMGKVLKVTWLTKANGLFQPILIESLQIAKGNVDSVLRVNFLAFEKATDPNYLFVGTGTSIAKVVISRCLRIPNLTRNCCYAARDPYCGWCEALGKCTSKPDCSSDWEQSLTADPPETCESQDNTQTPFPITTPAPTTPAPTTKPATTPRPTTKPETEPPTTKKETEPPEPTEPEPTKPEPTEPEPPKPEPTEPEPTEPEPPKPETTKPEPEPPTTKVHTTPPPDKNITEPVTQKPEPETATKASTSKNNTDPSDTNKTQTNLVKSQTESWKTVAIVMAILCGIFVIITCLLALNLARKWCYANRSPPQKLGNHNLQHSYNPLSATGQKTDDFSSDRIPVYNTRTNNV